MDYLTKSVGLNNASRVLIIFPHPDDETFACGGLIQKINKIKAPLRVVCLTKGEQSTLKFGLKNNQKLADIRTQEFQKVTKVLGIRNPQIYDLPDGELETKFAELNKIIIEEIQSFKPTHVITYEPDGIYGHPDHIFLSATVTKLAQQYNIKLIYATVSDQYQQSPSSLQMAKEPSTIKPLSPNTKINLNLAEYIKKMRALRSYKSQFNLKHETFNFLANVRLLKTEFFYVVE